MSINAFTRLRTLLPPSPLLVVRVVQVHADDTSTVELPQGLGQTSIGPGLAVGTRLRVRGAQVPVGGFAFVRDGVIESRAPSEAPTEAVVGVVAAQPFGPPRLATASAPPAPQVAPVGAPWALDLAPFFTGGYRPLVYTVLAGALPAGLVLDSASGLLQGTASTAAAPRLITVRCTDSTHRRADLPAFSLQAV